MKPVRLRYTYALLSAYRAFEPEAAVLVEPRPATDEEIGSYHTPEYIEAVKSYGRGQVPARAHLYNFGPGDNPAYEGVYEAAALSTGASMVAAELLIEERVDAAINISGGLHHAAAFFERLKLLVVHVAWMIAQRPRARMRGDDGRA